MKNTRERSYFNKTGQDVSMFHSVIVAAIENGGTFTDDYSDIFTLTANPEGIRTAWILDMAEDN